MNPFVAFKVAIEEVNSRNDILPDTTLLYALRDSKRDEGAAFFEAVHLTTEAFDGQGVSAIVELLIRTQQECSP